MRIAILGVQVPFVRGGAELLNESLQRELRARGHQVCLIRLPFKWFPHRHLHESCLAWRLLDLERVCGPLDRVIATRFPSYCIRHPKKVVWLVHQHRQAYDLLTTPFTDFGYRVEDIGLLPDIYEMDRRCLAEARRLCAISRNVAQRLERWTDLTAEVLYPPPNLTDQLHDGPSGDEILFLGRMEANKRPELLIQSLARTHHPIRAVLAGTGPGLEALQDLVADLNLEDRVTFAGYVPDDDVPELYARSLGVFYAPFDEDYGYVTVEAMMAGKPVVTCADSGGVLEFVEEGMTGFVRPPEPELLATALDRLWEDREAAGRMGREGAERVGGIRWDGVIDSLLQEVGDAPA